MNPSIRATGRGADFPCNPGAAPEFYREHAIFPTLPIVVIVLIAAHLIGGPAPTFALTCLVLGMGLGMMRRALL